MTLMFVALGIWIIAVMLMDCYRKVEVKVDMPNEVCRGDAVPISVNISNPRRILPCKRVLSLKIGQEHQVLRREKVEVPPGSSRTVRFVLPFDHIGKEDILINGERYALTVHPLLVGEG